MSSEPRRWHFYVLDMLRAIERIQVHTAGRTFEEFARDQDSVEIVAWNFHVLGEASVHIPRRVAEAHPEVPWVEMRTMRNRIVHGYFHLNPQILWDTAVTELPPVVDLLRTVARHDESGS